MAGRPHPAATNAWPGLMTRATAASYCNMTENSFANHVAAGRMPASVLFGNDRRWKKVDIDRIIDPQTDTIEPDWRAASKLYAAQ